MRKHLSHEFRRPVPDYSQRSFAWVFDRISDFRGPLVFDPFCGVGGSTVKLAKAMPDALVVGIDKSAHRLNKHDGHYRLSGIDNYLRP